LEPLPLISPQKALSLLPASCHELADDNFFPALKAAGLGASDSICSSDMINPDGSYGDLTTLQ